MIECQVYNVPTPVPSLSCISYLYLMIFRARTHMVKHWIFWGQNKKILPPCQMTWGCWGSKVHISWRLAHILSIRSSETRAGFAWNPIFELKPLKKNSSSVWFFTQNQVKPCGSAKFWLEARENSLCLDGSCFTFHVPFGSLGQTWNLGFRQGIQNEENWVGMKSGADEHSISFIRAMPLSWVTVCSCFLSTCLLEGTSGH